MNRLKGMRCYLSGPMDRVEGGGVQWRQEITPFLHGLGCGVFDPCNKPLETQVEDADLRAETDRLKSLHRFDEVRNLWKPIAGVDLRMVNLADFSIVHVLNDVHLCGTYFECATGVVQRQPLIIHCPSGKHTIPNFLFGLTPHEWMFESLDEVREYLLKVHKGEDEDHKRRWTFFNYDKVFGSKV